MRNVKQKGKNGHELGAVLPSDETIPVTGHQAQKFSPKTGGEPPRKKRGGKKAGVISGLGKLPPSDMGTLQVGAIDAQPPIHKRHEPPIPDGLPKKYFLKSTFNTQDIMHAPVEKTLKMLDKILAGERLFAM